MTEVYGTPLDYGIVFFYFLFVLGFGSIFGRYTRSTRDFFFSGQRFSWWLIAFSCIATVVGSYSFIKYSSRGFVYGLSSSMTYLNDWFIAPLFMLGWLPIIYFSRISSIPEYFERRFNRPARIMAIIFIMLYMVGYIGINFYTLGVALKAVLGGTGVESIRQALQIPPEFYQSLGGHAFAWAVVIAIICAIYVTAGGQTAVIMTDLLQGFLLLVAGFALLFLGVHYLGGWERFWNGLPVTHRMPFSSFNSDPAFPYVGIFWQDLFGSSMAFYFANQGLIMRFLACKSVKDGRKAIIAVILVLMPLAAIAVSSAGWIGKAMASFGLIPQDTDPREIFVIVSELVARPGIFGLILAALTAALMSTVDTLINAVSAIAVNDIWRPFVVKNRDDRYYLKWARIFSIVFAVLGLSLVPVYASFKSIYEAHAAFTAASTPPLIVAVILGMTWKRYTPWAAFWTLLGGGIAVGLSIKWPILIYPFSHGIPTPGGYNYMRALYGLITSGAIAVIVTYLTRPKPDSELTGYIVSTLSRAKELFKGGPPNDREPGEKVLVTLIEADTEEGILDPEAMAAMKARPGDMIYVNDRRWWTGGLRSIHVKAGEPKARSGEILLSRSLIQESRLRAGEKVRVEKIL
jgi:SSS family solute:Na+ symporter